MDVPLYNYEGHTFFFPQVIAKASAMSDAIMVSVDGCPSSLTLKSFDVAFMDSDNGTSFTDPTTESAIEACEDGFSIGFTSVQRVILYCTVYLGFPRLSAPFVLCTFIQSLTVTVLLIG